MSRLPTILVALMILTASAVASAHSYKLGDLSIGHIWAPPTTDTDGAAVYVPFLNQGATPVRLVGASTPVAKAVRFRVVRDGETRWLDAIELAPGKPIALAPWREHIWLAGLKHPLKAGESFDLTLDFEPGGSLTVKVEIEQSGGH